MLLIKLTINICSWVLPAPLRWLFAHEIGSNLEPASEECGLGSNFVFVLLGFFSVRLLVLGRGFPLDDSILYILVGHHFCISLYISKYVHYIYVFIVECSKENCFLIIFNDSTWDDVETPIKSSAVIWMSRQCFVRHRARQGPMDMAIPILISEWCSC